MTDKIKVPIGELEIDLQEMRANRTIQVDEDAWSERPWTLAEVIVQAAATQLVEQIGRDGLLREVTITVTREVVEKHVQERLAELLTEDFVIPDHDHGFGRPKTVTLSEAIDAAIKRELVRNHHSRSSVLDTVMREQVTNRLSTELSAALNSAKATMLAEAQHIAADALGKAMAKAVPT